MVALRRNRFFILQNSFSSDPDGIDVKQLPRIDHKFTQTTLDAQLLKSVIQFLPVMQQNPVQFRHLSRIVGSGLSLHMIGNSQQVLFAIDQVVRPSRVHQLVIQKNLNMTQRLFHLQIKIFVIVFDALFTFIFTLNVLTNFFES